MPGPPVAVLVAMQKLFNCVLLGALATSCALIVFVSSPVEPAPASKAMKIEYRVTGVDGPWIEIAASYSEYWHQVDIHPTMGNVKVAPAPCTDTSASCGSQGAMLLEIPAVPDHVSVEYRITSPE